MSVLKSSKVLLWLAGAALSISIVAHLSGYGRINSAVGLVIVALACALGWLLARVSAAFFAQRLASAAGIPLLLLALLAGAAAYYVLPLSPDVFPRKSLLRVANTGERNPAAKGGEVWAKVVLANQKPIKPLLPLPEGWQLKEDGTVSSTAPTPAAVAWDVPLERGATLVMTRHAWSGIGEVTWLGAAKRIDLFGNQEAGSESVALTGRPEATRFDRVVAWGVSVADVLSLAFLAMLLLFQFIGPAKRN